MLLDQVDSAINEIPEVLAQDYLPDEIQPLIAPGSGIAPKRVRKTSKFLPKNFAFPSVASLSQMKFKKPPQSEEEGEILNYTNEQLERNMVPERASILKQIQCPTMAATSYRAFESIPFVAGTLIPEALGYVTGYEITGRGQNDSYYALDRMGITGGYGNRVLGYNYFLKGLGANCSSMTSSDGCGGKPNYLYVRNHPTYEPKGNLTGGLVQDITDMNPLDMLESLWGKGDFSFTCKKRELPVGTSIDSLEKKFASRKDFLEKGKKCADACKQQFYGETSSSKLNNCVKECSRGWWTEKKCTSNRKKYKYGNVEYFDHDVLSETKPRGEKRATTQTIVFYMSVVCFAAVLLALYLTFQIV